MKTRVAFFLASLRHFDFSVVDPDLELRGARFCFDCSAGLSSFCDFFLFTQNQGGGGSPGPSVADLRQGRERLQSILNASSRSSDSETFRRHLYPYK